MHTASQIGNPKSQTKMKYKKQTIQYLVVKHTVYIFPIISIEYNVLCSMQKHTFLTEVRSAADLANSSFSEYSTSSGMRTNSAAVPMKAAVIT